MYGTSTTKFGGIVPVNKSYGSRVSKFRYLRIYVPDNKRMEHQPTGYNPNVHGQFTYIDIREGDSSPNIMLDERVTLWSDAMPRSYTDYWLERMRLGSSGFTQYLSYTQNTSPSLYIDFTRRVHLHKINICINTTLSGYILYGSNNSRDWSLIGDYTQKDLAEVYSEMPVGFRWYSSHVLTGLRTHTTPDQPHQFWGIIAGQIGSGGSYFAVRQAEFRSAIGGSNLVGSGYPTQWVTCNDRTVHEMFDGNTASETLVRSGHGGAYNFGDSVKPVTIAIQAGRSYSYNALEFMVVYSDDERTWYKHKYFNTPEGTWPDGTQDTVEFIL